MEYEEWQRGQPSGAWLTIEKYENVPLCCAGPVLFHIFMFQNCAMGSRFSSAQQHRNSRSLHNEGCCHSSKMTAPEKKIINLPSRLLDSPLV